MLPMRRNPGFTLIEMLVVITILVILITVLVPSFTSSVQGVNLKTQIGDFASALTYARSESVKRGVRVTVCPSSDQATCGGGGVNWESGWVVFVDSNNNFSLDVGEGPPLRAATALPSGYALRGSSATTLPSYVSFGSHGTPSDSGIIVLCHNGQITDSRAVNVNSAGLIQVAPDNNNNGIPEDQSGSDLTSCTP